MRQTETRTRGGTRGDGVGQGMMMSDGTRSGGSINDTGAATAIGEIAREIATRTGRGSVIATGVMSERGTEMGIETVRTIGVAARGITRDEIVTETVAAAPGR